MYRQIPEGEGIDRTMEGPISEGRQPPLAGIKELEIKEAQTETEDIKKAWRKRVSGKIPRSAAGRGLYRRDDT